MNSCVLNPLRNGAFLVSLVRCLLVLAFGLAPFGVMAEGDSASAVAVAPTRVVFDTVDSQPSPAKPVVVTEDKDVPAPQKINPQPFWQPSPNKAMWYSVLCPGLGQIYNRSYWKVPVIYGGAAILGYLVSWQGRMYNDYSNAYYDMMDNDPNTRSYERMFRNIDGTDEWKRSTLRKKRDYYRRYRDLCIFGMGLLYVLNVVDAFVDAHLYDFSVTNDLSLHFEPVINLQQNSLIDAGSDPGANISLQCTLSF